VSSPDGKELIKMIYTISDFDKALLYFHACDEWAKNHYFRELVKIWHGLSREDLPKANSLMAIALGHMSIDRRIEILEMLEK
jgi:hypothetical protein